MALELSIRNKSTGPIATLRPKVLAAFLAARPESVALVLDKHSRDYRDLTGKAISLDYEQRRQLLARAGADSKGIWTSVYSGSTAGISKELYQVICLFSQGFLYRTASESLLGDLTTAEAFYGLLDPHLGS